MTTPSTSTVVLIHGLWMTPLAWEHWVERYEARGLTVLTPGYPGIGQGEAGLKALRENPDVVAGVGVREVMDYLTDYIGKLDTTPVIMGHSFGGTFAQLLVGNGLGTAGVSIDGAPVKGINTTPLTEARSVLPVLKDPANLNRASTLTPEQFHYAFTNTLDEDASQAAYDRYAAPTPAKILFQGGFAARPGGPPVLQEQNTTAVAPPELLTPRVTRHMFTKYEQGTPEGQPRSAAAVGARRRARARVCDHLGTA